MSDDASNDLRATLDAARSQFKELRAERDRLRADNTHLRTALEKLAQLGGGRSEGNWIAKDALASLGAPATPITRTPWSSADDCAKP